MTSPTRTTTAFWTSACLAALAGAVPTARAGDCHPYQEPKLTASDPAIGDRFGIAVSVHGDVAVSGAYLKAVAGPSSGAAYVFERAAGGAWVETGKLVASDGAAGDWFGVSVATDGERVLVGAQLHDSAASDAGAAYVFRRAGAAWVEEAKLVAPGAGTSEWLGHSVSLAGDLAVAGAHLADGAATDSGAVHVFRRDAGGSWAHEAELAASDPQAASEFGSSVGTDGTTVVVGARWQDDAGADSGAAYAFRRVGGVWTEEAKLVPAGLAAGDEYGFEVAVHGDRAVVGARLDDDAGTNAGALYAFARGAGGTWTEEAKLVPLDLAADDRLGEAVSIDGDLVVGGARQHDAAGADGGAAYVFARSADGTWSEAAKLVGSDVGPGHFFGIAADVQAGRAIVGANLDSEHGSQAGAAYVFELHCAGPGEAWQPVLVAGGGGGGVGGSGGVPELAGVGALVAPGSVAFVLGGAALQSPGALVLGVSRIDFPLFGGTLVPNPNAVVPFTTNADGAVQVLFPLTGSIPAGLQVWGQAWVLDATAPQLVAASDAVEQTAP